MARGLRKGVLVALFWTYGDRDPGIARKRKDTKADTERKRKIKELGDACTKCKSSNRKCDASDPCQECLIKSVKNPCTKCRAFRSRFKEFMYCKNCATKRVVCERPKPAMTPHAQRAIISNEKESALTCGITEYEYVNSIARRTLVDLMIDCFETPFRKLAHDTRLAGGESFQFMIQVQQDPLDTPRLIAMSTLSKLKDESEVEKIFNNVLNHAVRHLPLSGKAPASDTFDSSSLDAFQMMEFVQRLACARVHVAANQSSGARKYLGHLFWCLTQHAMKSLVHLSKLPARTVNGAMTCPQSIAMQCCKFVNAYFITARTLIHELSRYDRPPKADRLIAKYSHATKTLSDSVGQIKDLLAAQNCNCHPLTNVDKGTCLDTLATDDQEEFRLHMGLFITNEYTLISDGSDKYNNIFSLPAAPVRKFLNSDIVEHLADVAQHASNTGPSQQNPNLLRPITMSQPQFSLIPEDTAINARGSGDTLLSQQSHDVTLSSTMNVSSTSKTEVESLDFLEYCQDEDWVPMPKNFDGQLPCQNLSKR